ncbi:42587_t:CDS:1, partial [Gigaspora margarita]
RGQIPKRLKDALDDITSTHHNVLGPNKAISKGSNIQERNKNKCTNCEEYRHNI